LVSPRAASPLSEPDGGIGLDPTRRNADHPDALGRYLLREAFALAAA